MAAVQAIRALPGLAIGVLPVLAAVIVLSALAPAASAQDARRKQEILFDELPERSAGDGPFGVAAKATSGLPVKLEVISGPAAIDGKKVRLTGMPGLVIMRATQGGDALFQPAAPAERAFTVNPRPAAPQILRQPAGILAAIGDVVILSAAASGEPSPALQWRKDGAPISGATGRDLTIAPAALPDSGSYDVVASNATGSATSAPARVVVGKRRQTIGFQAVPGMTVGIPVALSASATSGLPVRLEVVSGSASLSGATLTAQMAGTIIVEASQQGDATFEAAQPVTQSLLATAGSNGLQVP
jgi:hypothetical protein